MAETDEIESAAGGPKKPEREGLPPTYRMRADAHYVEQLSTRRLERVENDGPRSARKGDAPDAEMAAEPRERRDGRDRRAERVFAQLSEDLATIESLTAVVAGGASPLARRVNLDVIRAQAWRASWMLKAHAILDGTHRGQPRPRQIGALLGDVRDGFAPESRLTGFTLHMHASDANAVVAMDDQALSAALTGAVVATIGLIGQAERVEIRVSAVAATGDLQTIEIRQDDVELGAGLSHRFFDPTWTDRPGGWVAGLGAATARAVVQHHGGEAVCLIGEGRGSTLRLTFSRPS